MEAVIFQVMDGMRVAWNTPIAMNDGAELRADIFLPELEGKYPVLMAMGPYAKGLAFYDGHFKGVWDKLVAEHPEVAAHSGNRYQSWELPDPERWTKYGYAVIRVDSRGSGASPGTLDLFSPRQTQDYYDCIEWAARQSWCNGKVGLSGVSYYAMNQWLVASQNPPHLAAICPWEGAADSYRDSAYHGGIFCTFWRMLTDLQINSVQYGCGANGLRSKVTLESISGPEHLTAEQLEANRRDLHTQQRAHPLDDQWHKERRPDWDNIRVPMLSCGNWGGQGLHLRGNTEAFMRAESREKWLEVHGLEHWTHYYTDYGVALQKRFFDHYLKGENNGWDREARVKLQVRHVGNRFVEREENEWPIGRTQWTKLYLHPVYSRLGLNISPDAQTISFDALGDGVTFLSDPFAQESEITGPLAARLFISTSTDDADLFLALRLFTPDLKEIAFSGAVDPLQPLTLGWLRASHRKLDQVLSRPDRPYHTHDEIQSLIPGEITACDVELWPTSIVVPQGYRVGLSIRGRDYVSPFANLLPAIPGRPSPNGTGPLVHNAPARLNDPRYRGITTLHSHFKYEAAYLLVPVVPPRETN